MAPGESVVAVADHLEGSIPLRIARDVSVETHQKREEALVEEHSVGGDRIGLDSVWLDPVGRPAGYVIIAPERRRNDEAIPIWIVGPAGIVTKLRHPVRGGPPAGVSGDQLVQNRAVDLPPRGGSVAHQSHRVAGVDQVEAVP